MAYAYVNRLGRTRAQSAMYLLCVGLGLSAVSCSGGETGGAADMASGTVADKTAPRFLGAAQANASGMTTVDLNWLAASDDKTPVGNITYLVYASMTSGGQDFSTPTATTGPGLTQFQVTGLTLATTYYFVVRARDDAGNIDTNRVERSATTYQRPDTMPPTFGGVTGASVNGNSVTLSWSDATDDLSGPTQIQYILCVSKTSGACDFNNPYATTAPGATSYLVTGLDATTTYYFTVRAKDLAGNKDANTTQKMAVTGAVSFSGQVQPILASYCQGGNCHSGGSPQDGLSLSSAANSYAGLVSKPSAHCTGDLRVTPSMPDKSYLVWKLQGMSPVGQCTLVGSRMPVGGMLSAGDMNTIRQWITAGALNN